MNLNEQLEELESSVVRALNTIDELKSHQSKLESEIGELRKTNGNLVQKLEEKDKEIAAMKANFEARSNELDAFKSREDVLKEKLPELLARLAGKTNLEKPKAEPKAEAAAAPAPEPAKGAPHLRIEPPPLDNVLTEADAPLLHKPPVITPIHDEDFAPPMPTRKAG